MREYQKINTHDKSNNIEVNDIVIIHEDCKRRVSWEVGVIESLNYSNDGKLYVGNVCQIQRPISRLYPLEYKEKLNQRKSNDQIRKRKMLQQSLIVKKKIYCIC